MQLIEQHSISDFMGAALCNGSSSWLGGPY